VLIRLVVVGRLVDSIRLHAALENALASKMKPEKFEKEDNNKAGTNHVYIYNDEYQINGSFT